MRKILLIILLLSLCICADRSIAYSRSLVSRLASTTINVGIKIQPLGVDNKSIHEDSKLVSLLVKTWGEVKQVSPDGTWFTISDGYSKPVKVIVNKVALPSNFAPLRSVDITGIVSLESDDSGHIYPIVLLGEIPVVH